MLQRIREAMRGGRMFKMGSGSEGGPVEVDEAFIGPNPQKMHRARRLKMKSADNHMVGKTIVMGMLDRDARQVRAQVVPNVQRETLQNAILNQVEGGAKVYTDNQFGYDLSILALRTTSTKRSITLTSTFAAKSTPTASRTSGRC